MTNIAILRNTMIIVKMDGGLGNQMFIYAFAKNLESKGYEVSTGAALYAERRLKEGIK